MLFKVLMLVGFLLSFLFIWGYFSALAKCDRLDVKNDAFEMWCQWRIRRISFTDHISNQAARAQAGCTTVCVINSVYSPVWPYGQIKRIIGSSPFSACSNPYILENARGCPRLI